MPPVHRRSFIALLGTVLSAASLGPALITAGVALLCALFISALPINDVRRTNLVDALQHD